MKLHPSPKNAANSNRRVRSPSIAFYTQKEGSRRRNKRAWPGIEPGTSSNFSKRVQFPALRRNHTTRPPSRWRFVGFYHLDQDRTTKALEGEAKVRLRAEFPQPQI